MRVRGDKGRVLVVVPGRAERISASAAATSRNLHFPDGPEKEARDRGIASQRAGRTASSRRGFLILGGFADLMVKGLGFLLCAFLPSFS